MKTNDLIIDVRRQLPWHRRYMSNTTTMMMWAGWLFLWRPFVLIWLLVELEKNTLIGQLFGPFSVGVEHGITMLISCSVALLLWSNYMPAKSVKRTIEKDVTDYARYFELEERNIHQARAQKVSTVHHDETGRITHID